MMRARVTGSAAVYVHVYRLTGSVPTILTAKVSASRQRYKNVQRLPILTLRNEHWVPLVQELLEISID